MENIKKIIKNEVQKSLSFDEKNNNKEEKKAIKENADIFDDLDDIFDRGEGEFDKEGKSSLDPELKTAMVLNNLDQNEVVLFDAYTKYNPQTLGAHASKSTGTLFDKVPREKLPDVAKELRTIISNGRRPVSWGEDQKLKTEPITDPLSLAKWQSSAKNKNIISYNNGRLTPTGKAQIEFLARMVSGKPDPSSKIEELLLDSKYKNLIIANSEAILRDYFYHVLIPMAMALTKRQSFHPEDWQLEDFIVGGLDKAIDKTKEGKYNTGKGNYGAWVISTVKNSIIDKLKKITDFKVDESEVYEMLRYAKGPLKIQSSLDPKEAQGVYDSVEQIQSDSEGKQYWNYIYNDPMNVLSDLVKTSARKGEEDLGGKLLKSPLQARYLKDPGKFYKGVAKELQSADIEKGGEYEIDTDSIIDVQKLPQEAKNEIYGIFDNVLGDIRANVDKYKAKNFIKNMETFKDATKELMFKLLQYGGMVPVYAKPVELTDGVRAAGSPVVLNPRTGMPEATVKGVFPDVQNGLIKYVWRVRRDFGSDEGLKTELTKSFVEEMINKGIAIPEKIKDINSEAGLKDAKFFVNGVYSLLKKYFGSAESSSQEVNSKRADLDVLLQNISSALLAENFKKKEVEKARKLIQNIIKMKITLSELRQYIRTEAKKLLENESSMPDAITYEAEGVESSFENNPEDSQEKTEDSYSNVGSYLKGLSSKFSPEKLDELDREVSYIIERGRGERNFQNQNGNTDEFNYITSSLAGQYKNASETQKDNIKSYLLFAYSPFSLKGSGLSNYGLMVGKRAGIAEDLFFSTNVKVDEYHNMISEAIYEAVLYALNNYDSNKGNFGSLLTFKSISNVKDNFKDVQKKLPSDMVSRLDDPIYGSEGEDDSDTGAERLAGADQYSFEQKGKVRAIGKAMSEFVREKFSSTRFEKALELYNLLVEEGMSLDEISQMTGTKVATLTVAKHRLEEALTHFVEDGSLPRYIKDKTGIKMDFPDNRFSVDGMKELYMLKKAFGNIGLAEVKLFIKKLVAETFK
jgi:hypothetical protein